MEPDRKPEIVDLARYKQAVKAQAKRKAVQTPKSEPLLGGRPRAGLILVLQDGAIVEQGTHEALMAQHGIYQDIYELQLRPQEERIREAAVVPDNGGAQ